MLEIINKWVGFISLAWLTFVDQKLLEALQFVGEHPLFLKHLICNAIIAYVGQSFVYWVVTEFKQHVVPFIISCRKIFTVCISIVWYKHETSIIQMSGIVIVLLTICYEFYSELRAKPQEKIAIDIHEQENLTKEGTMVQE